MHNKRDSKYDRKIAALEIKAAESEETLFWDKQKAVALSMDLERIRNSLPGHVRGQA